MDSFDNWGSSSDFSSNPSFEDEFSPSPNNQPAPVSSGGWHWPQTLLSLLIVSGISFLFAYLTREVTNRNILLIGLSFMVPLAAMLFAALLVENSTRAMTPYYSRKAQVLVAVLGSLATFVVGCLSDAIYLAPLEPVYETVTVTTNQCNFIFLIDKSSSMGGTWNQESVQAVDDILDDLPDDVYVGLVLFTHQLPENGTVFMAPMTSSHRATLKNTIQQPTSGGTNFDLPLKMALTLYDQANLQNSYPTRVVMVTDGESKVETADSLIPQFQDKGLSVSCIQLSSTMPDMLKQIINATGGSAHSINDYSQLTTTLQQVTQQVNQLQYEIDQDLLRSRSPRAKVITLIMMLLEGLCIGISLWLMLSVKGQFRFQVILSPLMALAAFAMLKFAPLSIFNDQQWLLEGAAFTLLGVVFMRRNRSTRHVVTPGKPGAGGAPSDNPFDF
ncbi:MAG: vWA domain-containing protein [Aristaeellaceae bacterium]